MSDELERVVARIMQLLAASDYYAIESLTNGVRLSAAEIEHAIREYGRQVVVPPRTAFELMDATEIVTATAGTWSVTMPLWTAEEGRSDLSLEMTIVVTDGSATVIELDNIHVL
jgi:hypothetical protein